MQCSSQVLGLKNGYSWGSCVSALVGATAAICAVPSQGAVIGSMDLDHQILDGETFTIPGVNGINFINKPGAFNCHSVLVAGSSRLAYPPSIGGGSVVLGSVIGPSEIIPSDLGIANCNADATDEFLLGFSFEDLDGVHYGWVDWSFDNTSADRSVLHSYGYEDVPRTAISVGDVGQLIPEPSALALAAAGLAAGIGIRRRRGSRFA